MVRRFGGNALFGTQAGSPNYAQGGSGNRFAYDDELIRQSTPELFGESMMEVLPTWAPYKWAFSDHGDEPEDAIAYGPAERLDRNWWGGFYYGYHPYEDHGYPAVFDNASYSHWAKGAHDPLFDPDQDFWHFSTPPHVQPEVHEVNPWRLALHRAMGRFHNTHPARSDAGFGTPKEFEELSFDGGSF